MKWLPATSWRNSPASNRSIWRGESAARYEDLSFQVRQREADNIANLERRRSAVQQAEADLAKALLEVSKAEILECHRSGAERDSGREGPIEG